MRRSRLNLRTVLTALSLIIFAARLLLFPVSYFAPFEKVWEWSGGQFRMGVVWGSCGVFSATGYPHRRFNVRQDVQHLRGESEWGNQDGVFLGVAAYGGVGTTRWSQGVVRTRYWAVRISLLWITFLSALLPAGRLLRTAIRRHTRGKGAPGLCANCGYDLRATPGRCPECGAVPAPARVSASD